MRVFRMPLHADAEAPPGRLDRLDHAVRRAAADHHARADPAGRLVMGAVDREPRRRRRSRAAGCPAAPRPSCPGSVRGLGCSCASASGIASGMCWIEVAAEHDVEQLLAAADAEHRLVARERGAGDRELERGAPVLGPDRRVTLAPRRRARDRGRRRRRSRRGRRAARASRRPARARAAARSAGRRRARSPRNSSRAARTRAACCSRRAARHRGSGRCAGAGSGLGTRASVGGTRPGSAACATSRGS